ncbi:MAG: helix-turn-helix domain-containing protein [Sulfitobacter sp.]
MGLRETAFDSVDHFDPVCGVAASQSVFEIFVTNGFSEIEVAAITDTLRTANSVLAQPVLSWRCVSDTPGFVRGNGGMIVEVEAALDDIVPPHTMIVVGGSENENHGWVRRLRIMQQKMLPVALLSDAATQYIKTTKPAGRVTTHWRDAAQLEETGYYPTLTTRFSEKSNGIITAAGRGSTAEFVIGLISPFLTSAQLADLGSHMLLGTIRKSDAEQPKDIADNAGLFDAQITQTLRLMEDAIVDPLSIQDLADAIGISTRQLERAFKASLNDTPARFYKRLRAKRARVMIEETLLPLIDVAVATGFGSCGTLAKAIKDEYGVTPSKMRARKAVCLLNFED